MFRPIATKQGYRWWLFGAIALGHFLTVLDQSSLGIALPAIATSFHSELPTAQWVLLGYVLTTTIVLLPAGRLSDVVGRKPVYAVGVALFLLGAVLGGFSPNLPLVIAFKAVQGWGVGMITANTTAITAALFPGAERGKGMGLLIAVVGAGLVTGPMAGGMLTTAFGWRSVFFLGFALGIVALLACLLVFGEGRAGVSPNRGDRSALDWVGAMLSATLLTVFLLAVTYGRVIGWLSVRMVGAMFSLFVLLTCFVAWELKSSAPMFDLRLFGRRAFSMGVIARTLGMLGQSAPGFLTPFYLQGVLGRTAGQTGLIMAGGALGMALVAPISGRLSDRFGCKPFALLGLTLLGAGLLVLSRLTEDSSVGLALAGLALQGAGAGMFVSTNLNAILGAVESGKHGVVTAFLNVTRTVSNMTGVAVTTAVVAAVMTSAGFAPRLGVAPGGAATGSIGAFTDGMRLAYLAMVGCVLVGFFAVASAPDSVKKATVAEE